MKILVTGAAGFIGFHTVKKLIEKKDIEVVGIDNVNDYYPMTLKFDRLNELGIAPEFIRYNHIAKSERYNNFTFYRLNIVDEFHLLELFREHNFDYVIHLAAQAGVRYSLDNPKAYIDSNITGFMNILEACRHFPVRHLVYASSSSVYGLNKEQPFQISHRVDKPISIYAATKRSNELMAHTYSHLYKLPSTGLRFFTVYGPWGRPDMAPMLFAKAMVDNKAIKVFNNGNLERDFTYVDDIVEGVVRVMKKVPCDNNSNEIPYKIYNIGNNTPIKLMDFISTLEKEFNIVVKKEYEKMQDGDVLSTFADVEDLKYDVGYSPSTSLSEGIAQFAIWYKEYYNK